MTASVLRGAAFALLACLCLPAAAQAPAPAPPPVPAADAPPAPIPVPDIALQAEKAMAAVRQLANRARIEDTLESAAEDLALLERETGYRLQETRRGERSGFSLETLRGLEEDLRSLQSRTLATREELTRAALQLDRDLKELDRLNGLWTATVDAADEADAPPEVLARAKAMGKTVAAGRKAVQEDQERTLALQGRATDIILRQSDLRQTLTTARERAVTRLLYRDSPPLWRAPFGGETEGLPEEARETLSSRLAGVEDYARGHRRAILVHGLSLAALAVLLAAARRRFAPGLEGEPGLAASAPVLDSPLLTALALALLPAPWLYARPPQEFSLLLAALAAIPLLAFARRAWVGPAYRLALFAVPFYLADRTLTLLSLPAGAARFLLMGEALALAAAAAWVLRPRREALEEGMAPRRARQAADGALLLGVLAAGLNAWGYVRLGEMALHGMAAISYAAAAVGILARALGGILPLLLYLPPLLFLAGVRRHRAALAAAAGRWLRRLAVAAWALAVLRILGLGGLAAGWASTLWDLSLQLGRLDISVRDLATFALILWTTYAVSRLARFILEEEVFSRLRLERGLPYAVSTTVHYAVLVAGLILALTAIGVDMTKVTIVAGALTVGIGFGLQNIVNNFVSGLILLFERPVKVGDTVQLGDMVGRVRRIGIRATVVQSSAGAEVIVPNGKLIADPVTNWTLSSPVRQVAVTVVARPDADPARLAARLVEIARQNGKVLATPAPEVLFLRRGLDALEFELRAWIDEPDAWQQVRSELNLAVDEALRDAAPPSPP